jgi:hypothetical protein
MLDVSRVTCMAGWLENKNIYNKKKALIRRWIL